MMDDGLCVFLVLCVYRIQVGWQPLEIKNTVSSRSVGSAIASEIVLSRKSVLPSDCLYDCSLHTGSDDIPDRHT